MTKILKLLAYEHKNYYPANDPDASLQGYKWEKLRSYIRVS